MAVAARADATARAVSDRREIASFLRTDRRYAAYALGDLDGPNRHRVAWAMAHDASGDPIALAAHHEGLVPQPLFLMGDPDGCALILEQVLRPRLNGGALGRGIWSRPDFRALASICAMVASGSAAPFLKRSGLIRARTKALR